MNKGPNATICLVRRQNHAGTTVSWTTGGRDNIRRKIKFLCLCPRKEAAEGLFLLVNSGLPKKRQEATRSVKKRQEVTRSVKRIL